MRRFFRTKQGEREREREREHTVNYIHSCTVCLLGFGPFAWSPWPGVDTREHMSSSSPLETKTLAGSLVAAQLLLSDQTAAAAAVHQSMADGGWPQMQ